MKSLRLHLSVLFLAISTFSWSQLIVNNATNAVAAVENFLLGEGIIATDITYVGNNDQIASFSCTNCNLGISSGVVMSSGNASTASGPNNNGAISNSYTNTSDVDLALLSGNSLNDACILEFDFIPVGDSLIFKYVFGSDEYPEYTNSGFNDAFGFFLSGPGIDGPYSNDAINIALIPGTTLPVTINNVNNGGDGINGPCEYCAYYVHNGNGASAPYNTGSYYIQPDGFTAVLSANASVQCGQTYHIKLAIADAGDSSFNSWVFLEAGSFESNELGLAFETPEISPSDTVAFEGCLGANIILSRPASQDYEQTYLLEISGSAENGIDYETISDVVFFGEGVQEVEIPLIAIQDGVTEGLEDIIIIISSSVSCGSDDTLQFYIDELPPMTSLIQDQTIECGESATLTVNINGGYGTYSVVWNTGEVGNPLVVSPQTQTTYFYTASDTCSTTPSNGSVTVSFVDYPPIIADAGPDQEFSCLENLLVTPNVEGGSGEYTYEWIVNGESVSLEEVLNFSTDDAGTATVIVTDECLETGSDEMQFSFPPVPVLVDLGEDFDVTCLDITSLDANSNGGIGSYSYEWQVEGQDAGNGNPFEIQVATETTISVTVTDACENVGTDEITLSVPPVPIDVLVDNSISTNCISDFNLSAGGSGGVGSYSYEWTFNGAVLSTTNQLTYDTNVPINILITVNDECGNSSTETVVVSMPSVPVFVNVPQGQTICQGETIELQGSGSGGLGQLEYEWIDVAESSSVEVTPQESSIYVLQVTDECGNTNSGQVNINVLVADEPFTMIDDFDLCFGVTSGIIVSGGIPPYEFTYSFDTLSYVPDARFLAEMLGDVTIYVNDQCFGEGSVDIHIEQCSIFIPNIFTPNMDDKNATFWIEGLFGFPNSALTVYNRWGGEVYHSDDYSGNWDGDDLPSGTYYYVLNRSDGEDFSGYVHISKD
jgi:gliding motility-associated-like protein